MAHAWIDAHHAAGLEERFLRLRQLERWNDHDDEWEQRDGARGRDRRVGAASGSDVDLPSIPDNEPGDRGGLRAPHRSDAPGLTARVPRS